MSFVLSNGVLNIKDLLKNREITIKYVHANGILEIASLK